MKKLDFIFGCLFFYSIIAVAIAWLAPIVAGATIYESLRPDPTISTQQRQMISSAAHSLSGLYICLLIVTNISWIILAWYLLKRLKRENGQSSLAH
jgi:hypothetical protein